MTHPTGDELIEAIRLTVTHKLGGFVSGYMPSHLLTFAGVELQQIREVAMASKRDELPEELRAAYDEGYKLAKAGAWLDHPPRQKTNEGVQKIIATQMGFIDGLKEIWPRP